MILYILENYIVINKMDGIYFSIWLEINFTNILRGKKLVRIE